MNNDFSINETDMHTALSIFNNANANNEQAVSSISTSFKDINKTGLFAGGLAKISSQLSRISETSNSIKDVVSKQTEDTIALEMALKEKAEEIEVPDYFVKNNIASKLDTNSIDVNKKDGKSVNEGSEDKIVGEIDDSNITTEELTNIVKETPNAPTSEVKINVDNKNINNINNGNTTKSSLEDLVEGEKTDLKDILNKEDNTIKEEIENNIEGKILSNINSGEYIETAELNTNNNSNKKINLDKLENNNSNNFNFQNNTNSTQGYETSSDYSNYSTSTEKKDEEEKEEEDKEINPYQYSTILPEYFLNKNDDQEEKK